MTPLLGGIGKKTLRPGAYNFSTPKGGMSRTFSGIARRPVGKRADNIITWYAYRRLRDDIVSLQPQWAFIY